MAAEAPSRGSLKVAADIAQSDHAKINPGQLTVFSEIGRGRFKTVSEGCHCRHGRVAVLQYAPYSNRREVKILAMLSNSNSERIPKVYGVLGDPKSLLLAQEFAAFGSVLCVLQEPELVRQVTPQHKLHMAWQFADAVAFLETLRIIHTDLGCRNFLVFKLEDAAERTDVKLTDFTCVLHLPAGVNHVVKKQPQATRWCAPETVASNRWSPKTDAWSLGITQWELFAGGVTPWTACSRRSDVNEKLMELSANQDADSARQVILDNFPPPEESASLVSAHEAAQQCLNPVAKARRSSAQLASVLRELARSSSQEAPTFHSEASETSCDAFHSEASHQKLTQERVTPGRITSSCLASKSNDKMGYATPPTRCPSSPGDDSGQSDNPVFDDEVPATAVASGQLHCLQGARKARSPKLMPHQRDTLQCIQALLSSPGLPQKRASLAAVEIFLSSPEAMGGISMENQVLLRHRLAAALELSSSW